MKGIRCSVRAAEHRDVSGVMQGRDRGSWRREGEKEKEETGEKRGKQYNAKRGEKGIDGSASCEEREADELEMMIAMSCVQRTPRRSL